MKSFKVSFGMTAVIRDVYHKFNCEVEIELEEGDNPEEVKKKAWNTVISEIERKVQEAI